MDETWSTSLMVFAHVWFWYIIHSIVQLCWNGHHPYETRIFVYELWFFSPSFCQRRKHQHIFSILFLFSCVSALLFLCLLPFTWLSPGCPLLLLALLFPERVWLTGAYFFPCWLGHGTSVCCLRGRPVLSGLGTTYFWIQIEGGEKRRGVVSRALGAINRWWFPLPFCWNLSSLWRWYIYPWCRFGTNILATVR